MKRRQLRDYVIVFGAAVRPSGKPSAALRVRINLAIRWARQDPQAIIMPTGGRGEYGPAEAEVVKQALVAAGVPSRRIVVEGQGRDTLESVRLCDALIRKRGDCRRIICCTSNYHQYRCALLLRVLGYMVVGPDAPDRTEPLTRAVYAQRLLKEVIATPYDVLLLLARRRLRG